MKGFNKYADLYGFENSVLLLKNNGYNLVSYRELSIPDGGSPCYDIDRLNVNSENIDSINNVIMHRKGSITIQTDRGSFRFWK